MTRQEAIGEKLLRAKRESPLSSVSYLADVMFGEGLPENPKNESMGTETAKVYRSELKGKAEAGDRYAASMLDHLENGTPLADDPGGN